jgi:simple sugar transport system permease protein
VGLQAARHRPEPHAAHYAGIRISKMIIIVMLISGALAGLGSVNSIMGSTHYLSLNFVGGAGFIGIAIALMGRQHPVGIFLSAVLFGALTQGGLTCRWKSRTSRPRW